MMETKAYTTIDRAERGWPDGPWRSEPDKVQWPDETTGLPCLAVRNSWAGNWCGYVGVPPGHALHGKDYNAPEADCDVHGGLTFADECKPSGDEASGICHVPGPGEPEHVWWLGFDCAHYMDYSPRDLQLANERGYPFTLQPEQEYRTLDYVRGECARLAEQLAGKQ